MYQKKGEPAPATKNPDGSVNVLLEIRGSIESIQSPPGCEVDRSYEPVAMDGGTTIIRCRVGGEREAEALKSHPGVVAVWPETPVAPMNHF